MSNLKHITKIGLIIVFGFIGSSIAQENSGFTVNSVEGEASDGIVPGYDPALVAQCVTNGYGPNDGALCSTAYDQNVNTIYTPGCQADHSNQKCYQVSKTDFMNVKTTTDTCADPYLTHFFSVYSANYANCKTAMSLSYNVGDVNDLNLLDETLSPTYAIACTDKYAKACATLGKADFQTVKTLVASCSNYDNYNICADALNLEYTTSDHVLFAEATSGTYNTTCVARHGGNCATLTKADYEDSRSAAIASIAAAAAIQAQIASNQPITSANILQSLGSDNATVDSDVTLSNSLHLAYIEDCIGSSGTVSKIVSCSSNVDGEDLNQYVVSEIAGGASGTITTALLQDAGIPAGTADIATGNTCGPNENQSCLLQINSVLSNDTNFTATEIETALATYMDGLVVPADTQVADASTTGGCQSSTTSFAVPNPPSICASVNWNCSSNTPGISVTYTDAGKGNLLVNTTSFSGGAYSVTATLNIGGQTRTRAISGSVNVNQISAAAGAGYKTGWQPAWWKHYDVIGRAKNACAGQGGSLMTYAEIVSANATYNIIGNGTRTLFRDANGNADKSTSGRAQCSDSWPQGPHSLTWSTGSKAPKCKGSGGFGRNYTYVCKDIPCN